MNVIRPLGIHVFGVIMTEQIIQSIMEALSGSFSPELIVFIISLLPVLELRGGLIAATLLGVPFLRAFAICFLGNILPLPFIILFIRKVLNWMKRFKLFRGIAEWIEKKSSKKKDKLLKYEEWGLLLFVAIPIPGTGGWMGALVAAMCDIRLKKAMPILAIGVLIAGVIMSAITYGIPYMIGLI